MTLSHSVVCWSDCSTVTGATRCNGRCRGRCRLWMRINLRHPHAIVRDRVVCITIMGIDHGGGTSPPEFRVGTTLTQIVPLRFCHIGTKRSVLWHSKYAKIRFRPGLWPGPCSPRLPSRLGRDTPTHTLPHSAPTHLRRSPCIPQNSSQIYAYDHYHYARPTASKKIGSELCLKLHAAHMSVS